MNKLDYIYIRAWGRMVGTNRGWILRMLDKAREDKAPEDALFFSEVNGNRWHTFREVTKRRTRQNIERMVKQIQSEAI